MCRQLTLEPKTPILESAIPMIHKNTCLALFALVPLLLTCPGCRDSTPLPPDPATTAEFCATKTPYRPQQDASTYERPPAGFALVYVETVARHGSRGLSSMKYDDAVLAMCERAVADGAITALGLALKADVERIMRANFFLGYRVDGVTFSEKKGGYGNLAQAGIEEHQGLASRFATRTAALFASPAIAARRVQVVHSGKDRAVDSAWFFSRALEAALPEAIRGIVGDASADRYTLYFHKLGPEYGDPAPDASSPLYPIWEASQEYQAFAAGSDAAGYGRLAMAKVDAARASRSVADAARTVLERLFSRDFVDRIEAGALTFANDGTRTFTSDDGALTITLTGDGKTKIAGAVDAAALIYELYTISATLTHEVAVDFSHYLPRGQAEAFAFLQDIDDFYLKGPGLRETDVTSRMARGLLRDFFAEVDAQRAGRSDNAAKVRFTHAEVLIPLVTLLGIENGATPLPADQTYSYANNAWRGEEICPMAANVQWDVYGDAAGKYLVKMYLNEREVSFRDEADRCRYGSTRYYYDYDALRQVYLKE